MSELIAIQRVGVHVPKLRLARENIAAAMAWASPPGRGGAKGARAVCNWDEDALTMGVEAARAGWDAANVPDSVVFCSTTAPFTDRDDAMMLAAALDLPESTQSLNLGASLRAGTAGLLNATRHGGAHTLLVASDARLTRPGSPQEMTYGDAAAAFLLGPPHPAALATVIASRSLGSDFVDHYRMSGASFDYALEERWVRDESWLRLVPKAVSELLSAAGSSAASVNHFVVPAAPAAAARIADACGLKAAARDARVLTECGDAGAALPLLMFAGTLETAAPGELIVMLGIGQGVDALLLRAGGGVNRAGALAHALAGKQEELSYVRYLSHRGLIDVDFGMRAERDQRTAHTVAHRKGGAINAFKGGRCARCGTVQFPQARVCVNPDCRATDTQTAHWLADSRGRVKSFTEDWQAYAARPPYVYGNVEFAEGGNLLMEFTDVEPGTLKIGDAVRFVYRIKDEDRARKFRRYFWKATPV